MLSLPFVANLPSPINFWSVLLLLAVFGCCSGMIQEATYSMAGTLPTKYFTVVLLANALAGIFACFLRGVSLCVLPSTGEDAERNSFDSAIMFYSVGAATMILCSTLQFLVIKTDFFIYYLDWKQNRHLLEPGSPDDRQ